MALTFTDPLCLWLFLIVPLFLITHFYSLKYVKKRAVRFANFEAIKRISGREKVSVNWIILIIRFGIMALLILSASGMIIWYKGISANNNYVITIDASGSMLADDFKPNRLESAKKAALLFLDEVNSKAKIGVVSFAGISEIEQRLTSNTFELKDSISSIKFKSIHGTAIGDAIKASLNLFSSDEKPKVVILLTDGRENIASSEEFFKVVELAKKDQVTIYTIGIGTKTGGTVPGIDMTSTIDDDLLTKVSQITGGEYFRVESDEKLKEAYKTIASSSESNIPVKMRLPLILVAIFLLFIEWGVLNTKFKSIP